jgi:hypothetical protein
MADENDPNPPAAQPVEGEKEITIANEEEYEKAIAAASSSENPALYKSKVEAAYAETLAKEGVKVREENEKILEEEEKERRENEKSFRTPRGERTNVGPEKAGSMTGAEMGIGPGTGVGASGTETPLNPEHKNPEHRP